MNSKLQILLVIFSLVTFLFVIYNIRKSKMDIKYAVIWITWSLVVAVISIFPSIVTILSSWLGIIAPTNTIFLGMLFLLYIMSFYIYINLSSYNQKLKDLVYEVALLKSEVEKLKNEKK